MNCQMIRVISSPSISTIVPSTLIFAMPPTYRTRLFGPSPDSGDRRPIYQVDPLLRSLQPFVLILDRHPVGQPAVQASRTVTLKSASEADLVRHLDPDREVPRNLQPYVRSRYSLHDHRHPGGNGVPFGAGVSVKVPALIPARSPGKQGLHHLLDEPVPLPATDIRPSEIVNVHSHRPGQRRGNPG